MERILVGKKETALKIAEKILESPERELVLVIPAGSALEDSDVMLLKREAEAAGKTISIESVDKRILSLSKRAKIEAMHPLFRDNSGGRSMSDIILSGGRLGGKTGKREAEPAAMGRDVEREEERAEPDESEVRDEKEIGYETEKRTLRSKSRRLAKIIAVAAATVIVAAGATWAVGSVFGRAQIAISFKKTPWQFQGSFLASKIFSHTDPQKLYLPAEVFRQNKNTAKLFQASGRTQVSEKAAGSIVIYNAYGTSPQTLVANTRFATPDGKIFRLNGKVTLPGAVVKNGKLVPSSVTADITAVKAGADYNVGPVLRLTIPGFHGSPKYNGFYGSITQPLSGGFAGNTAVPTDQDAASAKDKTIQSLQDYLQNDFLNNRPQDIKILPQASSTSVTKMTIGKIADENGNFSVFAEAAFQAVGFREGDLKNILQELVAKDYPNMAFDDLKLNYSGVNADFANGQVSFSVSAQGTLLPSFSADDLKSKIGGLDVNQARSAILSVPELSSAKISLWPFWLARLPSDTAKISVIAN